MDQTLRCDTCNKRFGKESDYGLHLKHCQIAHGRTIQNQINKENIEFARAVLKRGEFSRLKVAIDHGNVEEIENFIGVAGMSPIFWDSLCRSTDSSVELLGRLAILKDNSGINEWSVYDLKQHREQVRWVRSFLGQIYLYSANNRRGTCSSNSHDSNAESNYPETRMLPQWNISFDVFFDSQFRKLCTKIREASLDNRYQREADFRSYIALIRRYQPLETEQYIGLLKNHQTRDTGLLDEASKIINDLSMPECRPKTMQRVLELIQSKRIISQPRSILDI